MKNSKKMLILLAMLAVLLMACTKKKPEGQKPGSDPVTATPSETPTEEPSPSPSPTPSPTPIPTPPIIADNAVDFAENLKLGWNLGNTLDATDGAKNTLATETSWGNPKATAETFTTLRSLGFNSVRIPISWGRHMSDDGTYTIDEEWMNRVQEVVDYAIDAQLYVIINSHHDVDFYYPTKERLSEGLRYIEAVWTQISERFKDYDKRLIFESMNEPRLKGTGKEWYFTLKDAEGLEAIECINVLNQRFVDTVRAGEGYNKDRFLMVPSYAANPDFTKTDAFRMPEDPTPDRLMLSVHAYTPYEFAMQKDGTKNWSGNGKYTLDNYFSSIYNRFVKNGYGVVVGEMGATNKNNLEARVKWVGDYTTAMRKYHMSCFWWDNNRYGVGEENFGIIRRLTMKPIFPEIIDALVEGMNKQ